MLPPEEGNHWQRSPEPLFRFMGEDPLLCKAICEDWQRCLHGVMFIDQHRASTESGKTWHQVMAVSVTIGTGMNKVA